MVPHTKAFTVLKAEAQKVFDFAIVVSYAVPSLKYALKHLGENDPIPFKPEHFDSRLIATDKVRENAKDYKALLSRYVFLSAFSFFEAYFHDVLREIIEFHGREELLRKVSISHNLSIAEESAFKAKRRLQEYQKKSSARKYEHAGRYLAQRGFRFPSSLLAGYGLRRLIDLADGEYISARQVPDLVQQILQLPLDPVTEVELFQAYREQRNRIAHGRADAQSLYLSKAIEANNFLRNLALKIDRHVVDHFFVVEAY